MTDQFTSIEAAKKGSCLLITAFAPDGVEVTHRFPQEDIKQAYGVNVDRFLDQYGDDEDTLWEMFHAVNNLQISEI